MEKYKIATEIAEVAGEEVERDLVSIQADVSIDDETYSNDIVIYIEPIDGIAPRFTQVIKVVHSNKQNGFEVDAQREEEIIKFVESINK